MSEYRYKAFISYRHLTLDKKVADKLQKLLEDYKVPKDLGSSKTNWRVFRDETELPTSNNLSDDIKDALHNSEFLIVLCSKETAKSRWCLEEITQFKELHNGTNENILTVLIEGEPHKVFPRELCTNLESYTKADGTVGIREVEVEPLAANIVADSEKESLKKLNTEYLRIVAPLLGCGYDDLYNRNYRKKMRRIAVGTAAVFVFLTMFSVYSGVMFMKISKQRNELAEKNTELQTKTDELNQSNQKLEQTNNELASTIQKLNQSNIDLDNSNLNLKLANDDLDKANTALTKSNTDLAAKTEEAENNLKEAQFQRNVAETNMEEANKQKNIAERNLNIIKQKTGEIEELDLAIATKESKVLYSNGNIKAAVEKLANAFKTSYQDNKYVPDAEYVLSSEISAFKQKNFNDRLTLEHNNVVKQIGYVGGGKNIVTRTEDGVYLWDASTGELKKTYTNSDFGSSYSTLELDFENKGVIKKSDLVFSTVGSFGIETEKKILYGYEKADGNEEYTYGSDFYIGDGKRVHKIDGVTGKIIWSVGDSSTFYTDICFVDDMIEFISKDKMYIFNKEDGSTKNVYDISDSDVWDKIFGTYILYSTPTKCYVKHERGISQDELMTFDIVNNKLTNPKTLNDYSEYENTSLSSVVEYDNVFYAVAYHNDNLLINSGDCELFAYNPDTGEEKWSCNFRTELGGISKIGKLYAQNTGNDSDVIFVVQGEKAVFLDGNTGELIREYEMDGAAAYCYYSENGMVYIVTNGGSEVAIDSRKLKEDGYRYCMAKTREFAVKPSVCGYYNNSYAVSQYIGNQVYVYSDVANAEFKNLFSTDKSIRSTEINSDSSLLLIDAYEKIYLYDLKNQTAKEVASGDENNYVRNDVFLGNDKIFVTIGKTAYIYDKNGQLLKNYTYENILSDSNLSFGDNSIALRESNKLTFFMSDEQVKEWTPKVKSSYSSREFDEGYMGKIGLSANGTKCVAVIDYHAKTGRRMEAYNIADGSSVILDKALSEDDDFKVEKFSWLSNDVVAVLYNNNKFDCFDVKTGKCIKSFEVKEDISDINEIIPLNSENIALVSDNYFISKFNTTTGTISDKLDLKELSEESITKFTSGDYDITADGKDIIFSSSGHAWVIDIDLFKVRYNIENYTAYDPKNNRVIVGEYNKAGYYPLYTTEELIKKAKSYIA